MPAKRKTKKSLAQRYPKLARQWHPEKNLGLRFGDFRPHSGAKVWWKCIKGHEWQDTISHRVGSRGCPYCSGRRAGADNNLAVLFPEIARQWHPTRNANLTPYNVRPGSQKKVWWICEKGHEWQAFIDNRTKGRGCPYCSGNRAGVDNNLAVLFPEIARQWHPTRNANLTPYSIRPGSGIIVWWICDKGHEWQMSVCKRTTGQQCPYCVGRKVGPDNNLAVLNPNLAQEWHPKRNGKKSPDQFRPGSGQRVWWICKNGHSWQASILSRTQGSGCPQCYLLKKKKSAEKPPCPKIIP